MVVLHVLTHYIVLETGHSRNCRCLVHPSHPSQTNTQKCHNSFSNMHEADLLLEHAST